MGTICSNDNPLCSGNTEATHETRSAHRQNSGSKDESLLNSSKTTNGAYRQQIKFADQDEDDADDHKQQNITSSSASSASPGAAGIAGTELNSKPSFKILVTPADSDKAAAAANGAYSPISSSNRHHHDVGNESDSAHPSGSETEEDLIAKAKKNRSDPTMNGKISWRKVADFSALLPQNVKLKLWNGVFKTQHDREQPEVKRISKILRTFVMLHLTREYKKHHEEVPAEIKMALPGTVKEPSRFIAQFLKQDEKCIDEALLNIYSAICDKMNPDDEEKRAKLAKKAKLTQDNYAELTKQELNDTFNKEDFLKTAFLQYTLYAFQMKYEQDMAI